MCEAALVFVDVNQRLWRLNKRKQCVGLCTCSSRFNTDLLLLFTKCPLNQVKPYYTMEKGMHYVWRVCVIWFERRRRLLCWQKNSLDKLQRQTADTWAFWYEHNANRTSVTGAELEIEFPFSGGRQEVMRNRVYSVYMLVSSVSCWRKHDLCDLLQWKGHAQRSRRPPLFHWNW